MQAWTLMDSWVRRTMLCFLPLLWREERQKLTRRESTQGFWLYNVSFFLKQVSLQKDTLPVSNIEWSKKVCFEERPWKWSRDIKTKLASRAENRTKTSTLRQSDSAQSETTPAVFAQVMRQTSPEVKGEKMRDGSSSEVSSAPWVNGDMPRPYHSPVICSQCLNDGPTQR